MQLPSGYEKFVLPREVWDDYSYRSRLIFSKLRGELKGRVGAVSIRDNAAAMSKAIGADLTRALFGPDFKKAGYFAVPGTSTFKHHFGGDKWHVKDASMLAIQPTLLVSLDLRDPIFAEFQKSFGDELPLFSFLDGHPLGVQIYRQIRPHEVDLIDYSLGYGYRVPEPDRLPNPLPHVPLVLIPMTPEDMPLDEDTYSSNVDEFMGGSKFIRILGAPLLVESLGDLECGCGLPLVHVAGVGYEGGESRAYLGYEDYFPGEFVVYFFVCCECRLQYSFSPA